MGDETPIARETESTKETDFFEEISGWRVSQYGKFELNCWNGALTNVYSMGPDSKLPFFFLLLSTSRLEIFASIRRLRCCLAAKSNILSLSFCYTHHQPAPKKERKRNEDRRKKKIEHISNDRKKERANLSFSRSIEPCHCIACA